MHFLRGRHHMSPLILLIFVTSFSGVFSRHRIRHHRDRFKRQQGQHLYLAGSYVYDGGEGPDIGAWTEWSTPSPCSRTCGGGVSTQTRQCTPGYTCQGPTARHFSCNTQDCPDIGDFRAQQCSEFDRIPFEGVYYQWVPYTKAPNQCELNCMPRGERFYYRHKEKVIDGTRCDDESHNVCVQGTCQPVGCDMMLGSDVREDRCRICGGDGSTCNTVTGRFDSQDLQVGYNDILLIPAGATNIVVREIEPSNNYLAVRNTSGHYYFNGNWRIDFPRTMDFAGCKFHYEREPHGFTAPDRLSCLGPTSEKLFIVLLYQDYNVGVDYEYSLPTNIQPGYETETYAWVFDQFTPCSQTCGGGLQYRNVSCAGRKTLEPADKSLCDANNEPPSTQKCAEIPCEPRWIPHPWSNCTAPCGEGGIQTREISCQQIISNGYPSLVDDIACANLPKPPQKKECNKGKVCSKWHTGPWKPCDHLCGEGKETRQVTCYRKEGDKIEVMDESECIPIEPKPETERTCNLRPCEGVDWITSSWSGCDKCGLTNETRKVQCATAKGEIHPDNLCETAIKPKTVRQCNTTKTDCIYLWYASQWSECSAQCGQGVQTRTLFCGLITEDDTVKQVEKEKCDQKRKFETIRNCTGEVAKCPGEWFSGPWSECSKPCGGGEISRKVVCLKDLVVVDISECSPDKIIFSKDDCNTQPCSEDTIIPTDVTKSVDESEPPDTRPTGEPTTVASEEPEYEIVSADECEDGEWIEEEVERPKKLPQARARLMAMPLLLSKKLGSSTESSINRESGDSGFSLDDLMLSDAPSSPEGSEITGSGDGELTSVSGIAGTSVPVTETIMEGSGDTSETESPIITELFDTDTPITLESSQPARSKPTETDIELTTSGSEIPTTGEGATTSVSDVESSDKTTPSSTDSSKEPETTMEPSDLTTSGQTSPEGATERLELSTSSGEISPGTTISPLELTTSSEDSSPSALTTASDITSKLPDVSTQPTISSESASSESVDETSSAGSTESSATDITEISESVKTSSSIESTESTESTESSETTESTSTSTISTDITSSELPSVSTTESNLSTYASASTVTVGEPSTLASESSITTSKSTEETEETEIEIGESEVGAVVTTTKKPSSKSDTELPQFLSTTEFTSSAETVTESVGTTESVSETQSSEPSSEPTGITEVSSQLPTISETSSEGTSTTETGTVTSTEDTAKTETVTAVSSEGTTIVEPVTTVSSESTSVRETVATTVEPSPASPTGMESTTEIARSTESPVTIQPTSELTIEPTTGRETISTIAFTEITSSLETTTSVPLSTVSGPAVESTLPDVWETTSSLIDIFTTKKPRMCKRKKQKTCKQTKYGCCWDNITPAEGPFDKGCPHPKTCKESRYGCCEDGVSPAFGDNYEGCPWAHCNETLFGCCPDNKTISQGNNNEGCPPPPPACLQSEYGCCSDNITEAQGPDGEGCEEEFTTTTEMPTISSTLPVSSVSPPEDCNITEFGCCPDGIYAAEGEFYKGCTIANCNDSYFRCCPDGITPAQGLNFKGCKTPCADSVFGCCPDGITPAHGYSGEGCCLASPYGCCPDNIVPARGPNLEGCGCQYSPYKCCPDNVTAARGYNNEGCGCQYTEHGCCPDEYTPAVGPDYQGCLCHTFQFGCCPDGVTAAKGPHQLGCGCRNTEFGCCSDDITPARGPNFEGCSCDASKYGCCPDGVTEASGDEFKGCEDAPEDLQEHCIHPKERGSCRNYTVKWFFDMDYGGCSRFWYGGCEGNDNRFRSKEECDSICVKPKGTDRCKLPKVSGPCEGYYPQWFFDKERKRCTQFVYGGCLGNTNRFETREECAALCEKDESSDACEQEKEEGPCKGNYLRWYFDKESQSCQQFIYGGCKANSNNFATEEACKQQCAQPGHSKDYCSLPRVQGNCTSKESRWYHDIREKQCLPFYYSGCNGNNNNFISREACETDCPKEIEKDLCHLAADAGTCGNYTARWYFDTREKGCRQFYYGGCEGNGNNFETQQQCEQRCDKTKQPPPTAPPTRPQVSEAPFVQEICFLPNATDNCGTSEVRFYYDRADGVCKRFMYGGCGGNRNNFATLEECWRYCGSAQDVCALPSVAGPCQGEYELFYYHSRTDSCQPFTYGGCEGNYNRFPDKAACEQRCRKAVSTTTSTTTTPAPIQTQAPPEPLASRLCYEPADPGNCTDNLSAFFFNAASGVCTPFTYTGCGGNGNRFISEEQCERQCGTFRGQDVCDVPRDPGPCRGYFIKYYFDKSIKRCGQFAFGGCGGNGNRFSSNQECESVCIQHIEPEYNNTAKCELPADMGSCHDGYGHRRWYFDNARGECIAFIYSGCGGNLNNFKTFQSCIEECRQYLPITEPPIGGDEHPCQAHFDECATLRCPYGIEAYVDDNQCNRCQCQNPCSKVDCPQDSQCAIDINRNRTTGQDPDFIAICREINKTGQCPSLERQEDNNCAQECRNDADCPLQLKCCSTGCGTSCVEPAPDEPAKLVTQSSLPAYTEPPSEYTPPRINTEQYKPQVQGLIGDQVTLNCAVTGNPTPRITWSKDNLLIDGTQAKYRIKLDQSLQIITLHKTDAGLYLCTADNSIGEPIINQIQLEVVDSEPRPASIFDPEEQRNVVVSLNAPAILNCLAMGHPFPAVTWWKDDSLIPLRTSQFEVRKDYSLLIHSVRLSDLGVYTCQAYNGIGKAASWSVTVRARGPYHSLNPKDQKFLKYIVNPPEPPTTVAPSTPPKPVELVYTPSPPTYRTTDDNVINPVENLPTVPSYFVPVRTNITTESQRFPTNSDITIPCIVEGYPTPQVQWYKDGVPIAPSDRILISDNSLLTIIRATKADSGMYQCEAVNAYSKSSSSITVLVDGIYIHPNCKDNRFFANCNLIVKAQLCSHKYYAKFCCRSCTEAGLLPVNGPHLQTSSDKQTAISNNLV